LEDKLAAAEQSLANCDEDLEFLREQITVCLLPFLICLVSLHAANVGFMTDAGSCYSACV
jgi:hypothetical protein